MRTLTITDTNVLKGIALLLLLCHHCFEPGQPYDDVLLFGHPLFQNIGKFSKLCVAIFVFLSGYGLTAKTMKDGGIGNLWNFYRYRYMKLMLNYWVVYLLFVPIGILFFHRTFPMVYGDNWIFKAIVDFLGIHYIVVGHPFGYNATWWFFSCIILLYFIFPWLWRNRNMWMVMIPCSIMIPFFCYWSNSLCICAKYLLPFLCGMVIAMHGRHEKIFWGGGINVAYVLLGIANYSMGRTFIETMSLGSEIFPTFWCMRAFLLASSIAYLNGMFCYDNIYFLFIELAVLWFVGWYWTFICLLGCFVPILLNKDIITGLFGRPIVQLICLMTLFLLIKRDECISTYIIDGISAVILLIVIDNSRWLKFILCRLKFSAMGKYTMSIYLVHNLIYFTLGKWLFSIGSFESSYGNDFFFVMVVCMMTILPIAFVLQKFWDVCNLFVFRILVYLSK